MKNQAHHIIIEELARRFQSGERAAIKELIRRFNPVLKSKIYKHTRDLDSLDDIVQECWYVIINNLGDVKFQIGFEAWALNIGRNKAVDWIRNQQMQQKKLVEVRTDIDSQSSNEDDSRELNIQKIKKSINLLPDSQKIILELFYKDNFTIKEISKILRVSQGTVKSRLFTAREHLKEKSN